MYISNENSDEQSSPQAGAAVGNVVDQSAGDVAHFESAAILSAIPAAGVTTHLGTFEADGMAAHEVNTFNLAGDVHSGIVGYNQAGMAFGNGVVNSDTGLTQGGSPNIAGSNHDGDNGNSHDSVSNGDYINGDYHDTGDGNHDDNSGDPKDPEPPGDEMPNPDGGPGGPSATPNPEGDDGEGSEGNHHGVLIGHGTGSGGGDGEGEGPGHSLSERLDGGGNNQQGSGSGDGSHGPHDPGEEMPNPDDTGAGGPISNVAHGTHSFWDQAAGATQGAAIGVQMSAFAVSEHAAHDQAASGATAITAAHDISGALSDTSVHSDTQTYSVAGAHDMAASLHSELGMATFHDQLTLSGGTFAHQMHV